MRIDCKMNIWGKDFEAYNKTLLKIVNVEEGENPEPHVLYTIL